MYDYLRGTVVAVDAIGRMTIDVSGIGYSLRVSEQTRRQIPLDGAVTTVYVRLVVKEDDLVLFGFADVSERSAFDLLTSVQQVGPTVALAVLSHLGVADLRRALTTRDVKLLTSVKGVGPKSADRIILELADKVERIPAPRGAAPQTAGVAAVEEAQRALVVLGFGHKEAADALVQVMRPGIAAEELLRGALGILR